MRIMPSGKILDSLDIFTYWLLNVSAGFMLSAAHNVLFFVLDWRTPLLHFLHFFSVLLFLLAKSAFSSADRAILRRLLCGAALFRPPLRTLLWPPVAAQLLVCLLSALVHSGNRAGGLYLVRLFDFLGTIFVIHFTPRVLGRKWEPQQRVAIYTLLLPLAMFASLSWLEFGHIEYDPWALFLAPFLALTNATHLLLFKRAQLVFFGAFHSADGPHSPDPPALLFQRFCLCYVLTITPLLAVPALFSFAQSKVSYDASWESIDITLIGMSGIFMIGYKYSELWLQTMLEPHHFCALEHTKYFIASIGQMFLQNMAHATVFAMLGKPLFIAAGLRYCLRLGEMRAKEKCGPKSSVARTEREEGEGKAEGEELLG